MLDIVTRTIAVVGELLTIDCSGIVLFDELYIRRREDLLCVQIFDSAVATCFDIYKLVGSLPIWCEFGSV